MILAGILSSLIFLVSLGLIFSEKINRIDRWHCRCGPDGGDLGSCSVFIRKSQALAAVDFNTLGLLLGMMILVALLEPTGFLPIPGSLGGEAFQRTSGPPAGTAGHRHDRGFDVPG